MGQTRTAGTRLRPALRTVSVALVVIVVLLAFVTSASAIPPLGHTFYGTVKFTSGAPLPNGTSIMAKAVSGSWTGNVTTKVGPPDAASGSYFLVVPGDDTMTPAVEGASTGDQIAFYIAGVRARLYNVATGVWVDSYPWSSGAATNLNVQGDVYYVITATAEAGGTINPSGAVSVLLGNSRTFTIAPSISHTIRAVVVDGVSQGAITSYTFPNVTANHTILARFQIKQYKITPTAGPGGTITPDTAQTVNHGSSKTFTIAPNTGYRIVDVKVDGVSKGALTTYTFTNVTANHSISATFELIPYTITPTAGLGGKIEPGTPQTVLYGGSITFNVTPDTGYRILDVKVDGVSQGAITSYTFSTVTADHAIAATFEPIPFTITPTAGPNGTISPSTPQTVPYGSSITFTMTPNAGYLIEDVKVDGVSQGPLATYIFPNVTADHTIGVTFKLQTYRILLPLVSNY